MFDILALPRIRKGRGEGGGHAIVVKPSQMSMYWDAVSAVRRVSLQNTFWAFTLAILNIEKS